MQHDLVDVVMLQLVYGKISFCGLHSGYVVFRPGMSHLVHIIKGTAGALALFLQIIQAMAGH